MTNKVVPYFKKNAGSILSGIGTGLSAFGSIREGQVSRQAGNFQAKQLRRKAKQIEGTSTRAAGEEERRARLLQSQLIARAAASGGGAAGDPTIDQLYTDIAKEGRLRALTQLYEGFQEGARVRTSASTAQYEGKQGQTAGYIQAGATILGAAGKQLLHQKYGGPGPPPVDDEDELYGSAAH